MTIYPCGTDVIIIKVPELPGTVTGVLIRFSQVSYEVTYYVQGIQYKVMVDAREIITSGKRIKIGYK